MWESIGWLLGVIWVGLAMVMALGCLGAHWLVFALYARGAFLKSSWGLLLSVEVVYGLINPVAYLLILQPAQFDRLTPRWLVLLEVTLLCVYWVWRLSARLAPRALARALLGTCMVMIIGLAGRDLLASWQNAELHWSSPLMLLLAAPLYAVPLLAAAVAFARADECVRGSGLTPVLAAVGAVLVASALLSLWRPSAAATRARVLMHRAAIETAASHHHLDPKLLAAIVYVTHREHATLLREAVERTVTSAWLSDPKSHLLISSVVNPSLGLAQVKPVTAQTAITIVACSRSSMPCRIPSKEYREVPRQGDAWRRIPRPELGAVLAPEDAPSKAELVRQLFTPEGNLELAALVLDVTASQWDLEQPALAIRTRPDLLATLYNIGFEHSFPNPEPRSNEFGNSVALVASSGWVREAFGTP